MSAAETEVVEAIAETEVVEDFDMDAAVDELAADIFPTAEKTDGQEDKKEAEEVAEGDEEEPEPVAETEDAKEEVEVKEERTAPQSWKKDMHESWGKLDKETQEYIELREEQMKEGVDVKKDDADLGMRMRDAFSPFDNILKKQNIDPVTASSRMMATHIKLINAPLEQRKELFNQLATNYGITNEPVDEETQNLMNNPMVQNLVNKVNQLEQNVNMTTDQSQQERAGRISTEVEDFASKHDHFDDLSDDIAKLIRADYSLDDAYKVAYRASPYFEKDLDKEREKKDLEAEKQKKLDAEKAKKAKSVNVKGRDTKKAPTASLGTIDDTLNDIYEDIRNRN